LTDALTFIVYFLLEIKNLLLKTERKGTEFFGKKKKYEFFFAKVNGIARFCGQSLVILICMCALYNQK